MTATPGADERRARALLLRALNGPAPTPEPEPPTPPRKPIMQIAFYALLATIATTACLLLRRPIARDTTVLAGALLGICGSAIVWGTPVWGWLGG
jgi:hypothetical protein